MMFVSQQVVFPRHHLLTRDGGEMLIAARLEGTADSDKRKVSYDLEVLNEDGTVISGYSNRDAPLSRDEDSGHYIIDIKLPLDSNVWGAAKSARFKYNVFDDTERSPAASDTLLVEKK